MTAEQSNEKVEPVSASYLEAQHQTMPVAVLEQGCREQTHLALASRGFESAERLNTRCRLLGLLVFELMHRYKGTAREDEFASQLTWLSQFRASISGDQPSSQQEAVTDELIWEFLGESPVNARES